MRTPLEQRVLKSIRDSRMIAAGDRVGVAVSGGADSVALLRLLERVRDELGIALLVIHFDHMLRGAESDGDAKFVADLAHASGLEFLISGEDVQAAASANGWNIEDAARRLRYAFFNRVLDERHATRIAIAHTADDQAETVLGRAMRGTGLAGLAGIYPIVQSQGEGSLVRPLLSIRGRELRDYLRERQQDWREDSTNLDQARLRARMRTQLLPVIERDFSPAIVEHLSDLARFAREEESFWGALVEDRLIALTGATNTSSAESMAVSISAQDLLAPLPLRTGDGRSGSGASSFQNSRALTERLIRRLYEKTRGDRCDLSARHVEQVIHLAAASTSGKRITLPGQIEVQRVFDRIVFSRANRTNRAALDRETKSQPLTYRYLVSLPERGAAIISVPELATRFRLKIVDWPLAESDTESESAALDAAVLRTPLVLRSWQPGDAYRPRGHRQSRKLKQMFLAGRIPTAQRACWPVLESGGKVVWARGMAPAEDYCANRGTTIGVVIEEDGI